MAEIVVGEVRLTSDGNELTFAHASQDVTITLDAEGVEELMDFVRSIAGPEINRRRSFRVPLHNAVGLSVQIRKGEQQFSVTPKDISVTGMGVELNSIDSLDLSLDDNIEVILEFEGNTQSLAAVVRRLKENECGLVFPDSMSGEEIIPPREISQIVMALQRNWMAQLEAILCSH